MREAQRAGVTRLLYRARLNPLVKAFIKLSNIKTGFEDHTGVDQVIRASSGIDWTLARAVALTDKPG